MPETIADSMYTAICNPNHIAVATNEIFRQINISTVVTLLGSLVGAVIGLVFMWWGVRKVAGAIMAAFRSGKLSI